MINFDDTQLRRLDMTLLLVFEEAMAQGKLSAAAKRLGLTQSAISHAINRLRTVFGDDLFIRTPRGVRPTPRALALRAPLAEALSLIDGAIRPRGFDPAKDERTFRIAATDYETSLFAPLLLSRDHAAALPRFIFRAMVRREAVDALKAGDIDMLLGYTWNKDRSCQVETLFHEDYLVVARRGHPVFDCPLDLTRYTSYPHVLVSPGGSLVGIVDKALAEVGASRQVALAVPYFLAALTAVTRSEMIATLPSRLVECHAKAFDLETSPPPLPVRSFAVQMVWNRRVAADPAHLWLRNEIRAASMKLDSGARRLSQSKPG